MGLMPNEVSVPPNHRLAERKLIALVVSGEWSIDPDGSIWRTYIRSGDRWNPGTVRLIPCARRRAEKRVQAGYLMVRASIDGRRVCGLAHRLVWQYFKGDIPAGLVVNHKNGLKDCNYPDNLEIETYSGNTKHAYRVGLKDEHGERNPAAKLSDHDIGAIRAAYAAGGLTMSAIAARFGCSFQHVSKLIRGLRRSKQAGATEDIDHRHLASERDMATGRFTRTATMIEVAR